MATSTPTLAIWTPGHDQFGRPCWQHKDTLRLYYEPSELFVAQPQRSFGYGPNPNVPAGPRFTPVAESGTEAFPPRSQRVNLHPPSGINRGGDGRANFSPAVNVWTPGYDQFGRPCWKNRETLKLYYDPSGQSPVCPPMALGEEFYANLPGPCIIPPTRAGDYVFPAHEPNGRTGGRWITREVSDPSKASSTDENDAASPSASPTPKTPSPLRTGRVKEAEQWSLKHNKQGVKFYFNSTTKKSQSQTPECLKKYTTT